jgi:sulfotransferase family protein
MLLRNMLNRHAGIAIYWDSDFYDCVFRRRRSFGNLGELRNRRRLVMELLSSWTIRRTQMELQALETELQRDGDSYEKLFLSLLRFYAQAQGKKRCGDKGHYAAFSETLYQWYPEATIIHLVRDPRDVVASLLRLPWADPNVSGNAHLWLRCNLPARRSRHRRGTCWSVTQELVTQPEQELRRFCG